jgi:N-acetyl-1-D-myo-inositol-2-amino-2-deoxy-alpha-D-glucopyranoside deacetylase
MPPDASGGILFVHAHPDDESVATGGVIARLVAEGVRVDLVTCTDGAEGEIHDPSLDVDQARPRLAAIRAAELACSLQALGDGAIHHRMLGYRDSGMMGTDANDHPDSFWQADLDAAAARLVEIVRSARPVAVVSYDENGNYGHPDHINAHRIALRAYEAVDEVDRLYEVAWPREHWATLTAEMQARGIPLPWARDDSASDATPSGASDPPDASDASDAEEADFGVPDAIVTTRVDVSAFLGRKRRSMECHRTQSQDMGWLLQLPDDLRHTALSTEFFVLRRRRSAPVPEGYREDSLA